MNLKSDLERLSKGFATVDSYSVVISDLASEQLGDCVLFIAKDNIDAAEKLQARLIEGIRSLREMPFRFPFFNLPYIPANKYRKMYIENWYLVLYQIKDDVVYVDYVVDCRRDYKWLLAKK